MADSTSRKDRGALARPISAKIYAGRVARTHADGDPLVYHDGNQYRRIDEVQSIVNQLPGTPVTLLHPSDGMIAEGAKPRIIGRVIDAHLDDDSAVADIMITDAEGDRAIQNGNHELSLGYYASLDADGYQTGCKVDHLAVLPRGRCGAACRIRTDGECGCQDTPSAEAAAPAPIPAPVPETPCACKNHAIGHNVPSMSDTAAAPQIKDHTMDELKTQLSAAIASEAAQRARADAAVAALDAAKIALTNAEVAATNAQAALTAATAKADKAEQSVAQARLDAEAALDARVADRVEVLSAAARVLGVADKDGKVIDRSKVSSKDIKIQIIKHVDGIDVAADKEQLFIDGVFLGSLARHAAGSNAQANTLVALQQVRVDNAAQIPVTGLANERAERQAMTQRGRAQWQTTFAAAPVTK